MYSPGWSISLPTLCSHPCIQLSHPEALWEEFKHRMCNDLLLWHQFPLNLLSTDEEVLDYGLFLIQQHLARENVDLYMLAPNMPQIQGDWCTADHQHSDIFIQWQLGVDTQPLQEILETAETSFNADQQAA